MSVSIISNLPLRPCSRGQERGGCLFTCRWRPGVVAAGGDAAGRYGPDQSVEDVGGESYFGVTAICPRCRSCIRSARVHRQLHERSLSGAPTVTVPRWCFSFFICIIFIWPLTFFLLPLHLCPLWLFLLLSIFILQDKTSQQQTFFFISLLDIFISSFSEAVFSAALSSSPLLCWPCSYKPSEWSREAMEQNHSERGSLMWPLWGSPAVGLVFNQAPGFNSQHARAPLTPAICGGCGGSQNPHALL